MSSNGCEPACTSGFAVLFARGGVEVREPEGHRRSAQRSRFAHRRARRTAARDCRGVSREGLGARRDRDPDRQHDPRAWQHRTLFGAFFIGARDSSRQRAFFWAFHFIPRRSTPVGAFAGAGDLRRPHFFRPCARDDFWKRVRDGDRAFTGGLHGTVVADDERIGVGGIARFEGRRLRLRDDAPVRGRGCRQGRHGSEQAERKRDHERPRDPVESARSASLASGLPGHAQDLPRFDTMGRLFPAFGS